jgi:hypothetical protein
MTKSHAAFTFSCETFFRQYEKVYFWTFTCKRVHPTWRYGAIFKAFFHELQQTYGGILQGVRVYELHNTHGIHWHCLLNYRMSVREVRRIGEKYGMGRNHVAVADPGSVGYMAKYLSKDRAGLKGLSKWRTLGGFRGTKCKNIKVKSPYHLEVKRLQKKHRTKKVPWEVAKQVMRTTVLRSVMPADRKGFDVLMSQHTGGGHRGKLCQLDQRPEHVWPYGGLGDGGGVDGDSLPDAGMPGKRAGQVYGDIHSRASVSPLAGGSKLPGGAAGQGVKDSLRWGPRVPGLVRDSSPHAKDRKLLESLSLQ